MSPHTPVRWLRRVTVVHVVMAFATVSLVAHAQETTDVPHVLPWWVTALLDEAGREGIALYAIFTLGRYIGPVGKIATAIEDLTPKVKQALADGVSLVVKHDVLSGSVSLRIEKDESVST